MRVPIIVLALMLACGAATFAASSPSGQAMLDACVSRCLNVSTSQIAELRSAGLSDSDVAMCCAIAAKSHKPIPDVAAQWQASKDWKQVASACNLSMADLASAPVAANSDAEAFNTAFFAQYYNLAQAQIGQLRRQGCSWDDINCSANAAVRCNQPIDQIASLRGQGMTWPAIATRYNVSSQTITTPVKMQQVTVTPTAAATGAGASTCPPPCPAPCPAPCPSVCGSGPSSCCANGPCQICDGCGRVVLNYDQVIDLYSEGYDWLDVAIAARISMISGYPIRQILTDLKSLGTWQLTLPYYAVTAAQAYNVADYPFPRRSIYSVGADAKHMQMLAKYQKPGTWPSCPRGNAPCPGGVGAGVTVVPVPCPNPCGDQPICPTPPAPIPCPTPSP
jgi:hypothetical protein